MRTYLARSVGLLVVLAMSLVIATGCKRTPEETTIVSQTPSAEPTPRIGLHTLVPPQQNTEIGITLDSLPEGLVITANEDRWLELYDSSRIQIQYTLVALPPEADGVSLADLGPFEGALPSFEGKEATDDGTIETTFGKGRWASGIYIEDDDEYVDVRVFVPHPSGRGTLVVYSVSPPGVSSVQERLDVIRELLTYVS